MTRGLKVHQARLLHLDLRRSEMRPPYSYILTSNLILNHGGTPLFTLCTQYVTLLLNERECRLDVCT